MARLLNTSLYTFNKTYDYQSVCDPEKEPKAAAGPRSAYVPTIADMLSLGWWASTAAWSMLQHFLLSLTFPSFLDAEDDISDAYSKESCITEQTQYFFENDNRSFQGVLDCGNCSRRGCEQDRFPAPLFSPWQLDSPTLYAFYLIPHSP
ncbi:voltage-dependent calcium channel subunit alpha-2/delta-1 isoform X5 [Tachysurus ichikawai]